MTDAQVWVVLFLFATILGLVGWVAALFDQLIDFTEVCPACIALAALGDSHE